MSAPGRSRQVTAAVLGLWLVVLCAAGAGDTGGRQSRGSVSVLATWTGEEGRAFRRMLDTFSRRYRVHVDYQGTTALREVLQSEVKAGNPPDIAVLPSSGELAAYAAQSHLTRLDGVVPKKVRNSYGRLWTPRLNGAVYGIAIKADLKSIVWYDRERHQPRDLTALAAQGRQWCVGMGGDATSGWPGTDWIEDILLQQQGKAVYQDWATGRLRWTDPRVRQAWQTWGSLFTGPGTAKTALVTDFRTAGKKLFARQPSCALEHQGSFIRGSYAHPSQADFGFSAGLLPRTDPRSTTREVSGDFAAMFVKSRQAQELMGYLASAGAQRAWANRTARGHIRPFFANSGVSLDAQSDDPVARRIATALRDPEALCLDASDSMPTRMRLAFQRAALEYLSNPGKSPTRLLKSLERVRRSSLGDDDQPWLSTTCG